MHFLKSHKHARDWEILSKKFGQNWKKYTEYGKHIYQFDKIGGGDLGGNFFEKWKHTLTIRYMRI